MNDTTFEKTRADIDTLRDYNIFPEEDMLDGEFPEIGELEEGEKIYSTSLDKVLPPLPLDREHDFPDIDQPNLRGPDVEDLQEEIERINRNGPRRQTIDSKPFEPRCAWYCPIHFFGFGWGIFIREKCIFEIAKNIANFVDPSTLDLSRMNEITKQLLQSAFYVMFLHEQFHHKLESLGFRLLIATGQDRYRTYKKNVYRPTFGTPDCLEESLANAQSFLRLNEPRYAKRVSIKSIQQGSREYLRMSFALQPPGYKEGLDYLTEAKFRKGLFELQSRVRDMRFPHGASVGHWAAAPDMTRARYNISKDIYVILPGGAKPLFPISSIDPGFTVSGKELINDLIRHYGYQKVRGGGKGSHVKLEKSGKRSIVIPGTSKPLSPGVIKNVLGNFGNYPLNRLPDLRSGRLDDFRL